jgi:hypothetical protein
MSFLSGRLSSTARTWNWASAIATAIVEETVMFLCVMKEKVDAMRRKQVW